MCLNERAEVEEKWQLDSAARTERKEEKSKTMLEFFNSFLFASNFSLKNQKKVKERK